MLCTRNRTPFLLRQLIKVRYVNDGDVYSTSDKRKVFYNKQRETSENLRMVKELEVPNMEANPDVPSPLNRIERFVPRTSTIPVQNTAVLPKDYHTHQPFKEEEFKMCGDLVWRPEDGCVLCNSNFNVSYKDVAFLYQFVSNSGVLLGPQKTGLCQLSHQIISNCISEARDLGLMARDYKPLEYQVLGSIKSDGSIKDCGY